MFILDPNFFPSQIPDPNFFHPGSASKNVSILTPKIFSKLSEIWSWLFIPDPDPDFLPIPDPGSRDQKGTGSRIRIRNTELNTGELEQVKRMVSNMSITEEDYWRYRKTGNTWLIINNFRFCGPWDGIHSQTKSWIQSLDSIKIFKPRVKILNFFFLFRISYCNFLLLVKNLNKCNKIILHRVGRVFTRFVVCVETFFRKA